LVFSAETFTFSCKSNRLMLYIEIVGKKQLEVVEKRDDYPPDEPVPEPSY